MACSMDAGLPVWFALDKWLPALFQVQASCGRTPVLAANVTMAEALMAVSAAAIAVTALVSVGSIVASDTEASE